MTLGFIIIRHVNSKVSDYYWKECYRCLRRWYDNPIMIIDDSSSTEFLQEDIILTNCSIIYDKEHKGAAEALPYYYFHLLKPFDTAVILHDSVFVQQRVEFDLAAEESVRFLWTFTKQFDQDIFPLINELCMDLFFYYELMALYGTGDKWYGGFGVMSVIRWEFLDTINRKHRLFDSILFKLRSRDHRSALERVLPLLCYYHDSNIRPAMFGEIHSYIRWGTTFGEYLMQDMRGLPVVKVWSGR